MLSHQAFVLWIYLPLYALLTATVARQWLQYRDRQRRDAALLFFVLLLSQVIPAVLPGTLAVLTLRRLTINAGYYLIISVLRYLQPVPRVVQHGSLATSSALYVVTLGSLFLPGVSPVLLDAAIDLFGAVVIVYTGAVVLRGAYQTGGVVRRRLLLIAASTYLVGVLTLIKVLLPVPGYLITLGMLPFIPLAYLGFATPAWFSQIWQRAGLYTFLLDSARLPIASRSTAMLDHLLPAVSRTVGAVASVAALFTPGSDQLVLHPAHPGMPETLRPESFPGAAEPLCLTDRTKLGPELGTIAAALGAGAVMIVPIATTEATFGYLIVFLRNGTLFPEDDLAALSLMTEQVAVAMGVAALHQQLRQHNQSLEERVQARTYALHEAKLEILRHLARAAEFRDDDTGEHQERVGVLSALLAERLGLAPDEVERIRLAAPLHDVGKIGIPDAILLKPGRLSEAEYAQIKAHTTVGAAIFTDARYGVLIAAREIALSHHEKWDGSGYPNGLAGEAIPLRGRIVAVADVFDALTHSRTYKAAWPVAAAVQEMERLSGTHFDPTIVSAFLSLVHSGELPSIQALADVAAAAAG